jgi:antiviral helicase SKI2
LSGGISSSYLSKQQVKNAARLIGDASLYAKMEEAQEKVKRDIVFAASLWLG